MAYKKGDRVGAIESINEKTVRFYGYGEYVGDSVPPEEVGGFNLGFPTPEIRLDDGNTVYGCECWWSLEDRIKKRIEGLEIVLVNPRRKL